MFHVTMLRPFSRLFVFLVPFLVDCDLIRGIDKEENLVSILLSEFSSSLNMDVCSFAMAHSIIRFLWLIIHGFFLIGYSLSSSGLVGYLFCTLLDSL